MNSSHEIHLATKWWYLAPYFQWLYGVIMLCGLDLSAIMRGTQFHLHANDVVNSNARGVVRIFLNNKALSESQGVVSSHEIRWWSKWAPWWYIAAAYFRWVYCVMMLYRLILSAIMRRAEFHLRVRNVMDIIYDSFQGPRRPPDLWLL